MVSFTTATLFSLAATGVLARPAVRRQDSNGCLTFDDAQKVANNWGDLLAYKINDTFVSSVMTPGFVDYSESVNTIIDSCPQGAAAQVPVPLLSATFNSRQQYETGQGQQDPINYMQQQLWHTCSSVIVRWETTNTAPIANPRPVVGVYVLETVPGSGDEPFLIDHAYSEFDAGAWLQNLEQAGLCSSIAATNTVPTGSATPTAAATIASSSVPVAAAITPSSAIDATTAVPYSTPASSGFATSTTCTTPVAAASSPVAAYSSSGQYANTTSAA